MWKIKDGTTVKVLLTLHFLKMYSVQIQQRLDHNKYITYNQI